MKKCIGLIAGHSGDSLTDKLLMRGYSVAMVGGREDEPGMNKANYVLVEDLGNHRNIVKFFNKNNVQKVIIGTGHSKAILLANNLENEGIITNVNYSNSLLAKDKIKFKDELIKGNFQTPKYMSIYTNGKFSTDEIVDEIGIPCVVKSATDAVQPEKVNSAIELIKAIENVKVTDTVVMIEEYIKGNDCTVAVVSDAKNIDSLGVTYYSKAKEYKLKGFDEAYSRQVSLQTESELSDIAVKIVKDLGFVGVLRVDFIIDENSGIVYILELNTVIVTGYNGSAYPFFESQNIDIAEIMIINSLKLIGEENVV